ncbi:MAG: methyltransferase [Chitinophagaceae bacterium]|nr:methyltransferase [Chitinophagaceae bacterium]
MKVCTDSCLFGAWVANDIILQQSNPKYSLDIGGGTGLLSLMLAQKISGEIHSVESDSDAYIQMKQNFKESEWAGRLVAFHSDIKEFMAPAAYDLIISNPPFYENSLKGMHKARTAAMHDSGLRLEELIKEIKYNIEADGYFYVLIASSREKDFEELLQAYQARISKKLVIKNAVEKPPFRIAYKGTFAIDNLPTEINEICIYQHQQYTPAFKELLKDYYLHL